MKWKCTYRPDEVGSISYAIGVLQKIYPHATIRDKSTGPDQRQLYLKSELPCNRLTPCHFCRYNPPIRESPCHRCPAQAID